MAAARLQQQFSGSTTGAICNRPAIPADLESGSAESYTRARYEAFAPRVFPARRRDGSVCAGGRRTRAGDKKDSSEEFLKAIQLTDIRSPGSPPFELDAKVRIYGGDGNAIPGDFKLIWVSPNEWREELTYSGYTRVRVRRRETARPARVGTLQEMGCVEPWDASGTR